jgi:hypothetical protein
MSGIECPREPEVLDAIAMGRWPASVPAELATHASTCPVCGDLALAASALHDDAATIAPIALPSAGQVWWRAELRARNEAAQLAQRPVIAVQVVAAVVVVLALVTGLRGFAPDAWVWMVGLVGQTRMASAATSGAWLEGWPLLMVLSVGFWLLIGTVAIYMVLRADRQGGR